MNNWKLHTKNGANGLKIASFWVIKWKKNAVGASVNRTFVRRGRKIKLTIFWGRGKGKWTKCTMYTLGVFTSSPDHMNRAIMHFRNQSRVRRRKTRARFIFKPTNAKYQLQTWNCTYLIVGGPRYWVPQKLPQIYTVIESLCIGKVTVIFSIYLR